MFKLCFTVPKSHAEPVKQAIFKAGAGRQGPYEECAWSVAGMGQFRPLKGSNPFIGHTNTLEIIEELKIETTCEDLYLTSVIQALIAAHPYEYPSYEILRMETML